MKGLTIAVVAMLAAFTSRLPAQGSIEVQPDRQNVVAGRIAGEWVADSALTAHLGGSFTSAPSGVEAAVSRRISIRSDPGVAERVPQFIIEAKKQVPDMRVYMAGHVTLAGVSYPFLLLNVSGNMMVSYFRPRGNDPVGDGEGFLVQLAVASEPANDILFIGGDFNNQPFSAFRRSGSPRVPQARR